MANLAPTAAQVAPVNETQYVAKTYIAAGALTAGQLGYINSAGKVDLARANATGTIQALTTGMRRGELLGLKWADIDFDAGTLSIQRSLIRGETSRLMEGPPKTQKGRRRVDLSPAMVECLRRHKRRQLEYRLSVGPLYTDRDYLFVNESGDYLHTNTVNCRYARLIARAGVPTIRFHDLRHTSATLAFVEDVHPKIVQERLGHRDIAITLNRYSQVTPGMRRAAADAVEAAIARAG